MATLVFTEEKRRKTKDLSLHGQCAGLDSNRRSSTTAKPPILVACLLAFYMTHPFQKCTTQASAFN
jgi:hypothetical protein